MAGSVMAGSVVFVGAGPGAADLITLRGAQRLQQADVVLFDALTDPALRDMAPQALWVDVGKRGFATRTSADGGPGRVSMEQATIDALLVRYAQQYRLVVRLKGGDPSVFGRLEEELEALARAGIACEVVPGVTAALAAAADTRRPLTRRGQGRSISIATAMTKDGRLQAGEGTNKRADTEVFYMAGKQLAALGRQLLAGGWPVQTPVCVVSRAGWPDSLASSHSLPELGQAALLHAGRPTTVTVGVGASSVAGQPQPRLPAAARPTLALLHP